MSPASPELRFYRRELTALQLTWKDQRAAPGLMQVARSLREWQRANGSITAVCTFSDQDNIQQANPFQQTDIHKNPGEVDWSGVVGNLHVHDQSGSPAREQVIQDIRSLVFSEELFVGVIDPRDRFFLFVKHFFYQSPDYIMHNLRTMPMERKISFMEAFTMASVNPSAPIDIEALSDRDFQSYLKKVTGQTGMQFFMGNLKNDRLTYYGQGDY